MDALEEESFPLPVSSPLMQNLMLWLDIKRTLSWMVTSSYYRRIAWASTTRSLKTQKRELTYTPTFNEYISLVEKYIEEQLLERIPGFNMGAFTTTLQHHKDEVAGDIFDVLLTFTDFPAFKEMFPDYRAEREGWGLDLSSGLVVISLCKSSSMPPSQNNLRH